jgi:hypothetical protein
MVCKNPGRDSLSVEEEVMQFCGFAVLHLEITTGLPGGRRAEIIPLSRPNINKTQKHPRNNKIYIFGNYIRVTLTG